MAENGVTGNDKEQTIQMIAELLWNSDNSPQMSDAEYADKYVPEARQNYADYASGQMDPWWWA